MPLSSSDHEPFTAAELIAFQTVAHRLNMTLSDIFRLVESRQRNPDAPFVLLDGAAAKPASQIGSPVQTVEPSAENSSHNTATESRSRTVAEEGDGTYAVIQPNVFSSADEDLTWEQHQGALLEGMHRLARVGSTLIDLGANSFAAAVTDIPPSHCLSPPDANHVTTGEETIGAQLLSPGEGASGVSPALQPTQQMYDAEILDLNQNAVLHPFLSPATFAHVLPSLQPPVFTPRPSAQLPDYLDNDVLNDLDVFTTAINAGPRSAGGVNFTDWENSGLQIEASSRTIVAADVQAPLLHNQHSLTTLISLDSAPQELTTSSGTELTVAEIHDVQSHRTKQRRGLRLTASSGPKSGVQKTRDNLSAVAAAVVRAGRLRSCAGCWIQRKKVLTLASVLL